MEKGVWFLKIDPADTSKMCSSCGTITDLKLGEQIFECPACGLILDRDYNASLNIKRLATQSLGEIPKSPKGSVDVQLPALSACKKDKNTIKKKAKPSKEKAKKSKSKERSDNKKRQKDRQRDHRKVDNLYPCELRRQDTADGKSPAQPCLLLRSQLPSTVMCRNIYPN